MLSVCLANVFNITLMRLNELQEGIDVKDKNGDILGKSIKAGKIGITQTIQSRCSLVLPILLVRILTKYLINRYLNL